MNKTRRRSITGMVVYMCIAMLFGSFRLLALIVHEDNDICHYYNGTMNDEPPWAYLDLFEGLLGGMQIINNN